MKKVAIVFGTRPEVIKIAPIYLELKKNKSIKPILISTGQHKEMVNDMLKWFDLKENFNLNLMTHNQTLPEITARVLEKTSLLLEKLKPDLVLVQGDTVSAMAVAISAYYLKIPVGHIEAGLRTNSLYNPFPEEMSRRLISRIASLNFCPTSLAKKNLKHENIRNGLFITGNTVIDSLFYTIKKIRSSSKNILPLLNKHDLKNKKIILLTMHRRENFGENHKNIGKAILKIINKFPETILLFPIHKNPNVRSALLPIFKNHPRVFITEPLGYVPFIYAMSKSYLILSDSGGVQEEAPSLGKPVLVLRETTERPEGIKAGCAKLLGVNPENIYSETKKLLTDKKLYSKMSKAKNPYGDGNASKKIVKVISKLR